MFWRKKIEKVQTEGWNASQRRKGESVRKKTYTWPARHPIKTFPRVYGSEKLRSVCALSAGTLPCLAPLQPLPTAEGITVQGDPHHEIFHFSLN